LLSLIICEFMFTVVDNIRAFNIFFVRYLQ
jgi:hypothetical protein